MLTCTDFQFDLAACFYGRSTRRLFLPVSSVLFFLYVSSGSCPLKGLLASLLPMIQSLPQNHLCRKLLQLSLPLAAWDLPSTKDWQGYSPLCTLISPVLPGKVTERKGSLPHFLLHSNTYYSVFANRPSINFVFQWQKPGNMFPK